MNGALPFIAAAALLALALGFLASRGKEMSLEQWTVGGRGFGAVFVFLLLAGEIYTTFTFLGGSGYAYGKGAPAYYILCYGTLAYVLSYFMLPPIWRYARENRLYSQADFFVRKYDSPTLGVIVALVDIVALIPYLVLQFKGLGIIVEVAGYGAISSTFAIWIGAVIVAAYVMVSGVHGSAWTSVAKDTMILAIVVFLGIYLPYHYYGGWAMFAAIDQAKPGFTCCHRMARACGGSPRPCCSPRWASTCGRTLSARSTPPKRQGDPQERDRAAALSADPAVRVFRGLRGNPAGSRADRFEHRPRAVQAVSEDVRSLVRRRDRRDRRAHRVGARLDDPDDRGDPDRQQSLPRRPSVGRRSAGIAVGEAPGAARCAGCGVLHPERRTDHRGPPAHGLQLGDPAVSLAGAQPRAPQHRDARGRIAGIIAGVSTVAVVSLTGANFHTLPWLPAPVQDLNIGVVALAVNFVVLILVSMATRVAVTPARAAAE